MSDDLDGLPDLLLSENIWRDCYDHLQGVCIKAMDDRDEARAAAGYLLDLLKKQGFKDWDVLPKWLNWLTNE